MISDKSFFTNVSQRV